MIKFIFADGRSQVLHPSKAFYSNQITKMVRVGNKLVKKALTLQERANEICNDLGAVRAELH